ncbi:hypothetical protein PO909_007438 [Leuciscus waleckii]
MPVSKVLLSLVSGQLRGGDGQCRPPASPSIPGPVKARGEEPQGGGLGGKQTKETARKDDHWCRRPQSTSGDDRRLLGAVLNHTAEQATRLENAA